MDPHFDGIIFQTHAAELHRRLGCSWPPHVVLDARPEEAFAAGHVPGARPMTAEAVASGLPPEIDPGTEVFVVGARPGDPAARRLSLALRTAGVRRVVELAGGMLEWAERRLPLENGAGGV